tara:strand:- start:625 stop:1140 length:516 start_codon:yes stop_codon:yes gene_type:complete
MALIKEVKGMRPVFGENVYLAENATVVGEVTMGDNCSVWFSAVIRADVNFIKIGSKVNIQDGVVIHCTYQKAPTILGDNITIGHNALIHGCIINDNVLIGMGAILMDGVVVESNSIVAAGAVVLEGTRIKSGTIYAGVPAKKVKEINQKEIAGVIKESSENYVKYSSWFSA